MKGKSLVLALVLCFICTFVVSPALAETFTLEYLQGLSKDDVPKLTSDDQVISQDHWIYDTLKTISKKYGLILGSPGEKFDAEKPLTRNEAAVILVSLVGKIQQDKLELTDVEQDRVGILKRELNREMNALTGRVARLEGRVTALEGSDKKVVGIAFGEDFRLTGGLQFRYSGSLDQDNTNVANFGVPLAELGFNGKLHEHAKFVANFKPNRYYNGSNATMMGDVYVSTNILPNHEIYFGQTRVPIGEEGTLSGLKTDLATKSQIARNYGEKRDIGVKVAGKHKHVDYFVGAYNGNATTAGTDNNSNMDIASWVNVKPFASSDNSLKSLVFGGGYAFGNGSSATDHSTAYDTFGWHTAYKIGKLGLKYEQAYNDSGYSTSGYDARSWGWVGTATYDLNDKFQLVGRYDYFDPKTVLRRDAGIEYTAGLNYFMHDKNLKFQFNYIYLDRHAGNDAQRLLAQSQFCF